PVWASEYPAGAIDDDAGRVDDRAVAVNEERREQQHLPRIRDRKGAVDTRSQTRRKEDGTGAPFPVDGDRVIGTIRAEADERPAAGRGHDTPAQAGVERNDTAGGNAAIERRDGELERRVTTDVEERPVEAAYDPVAGSIGDGDRRSADGEAGFRNQVFERVLQLDGQMKLPIWFFVLMVL